MSKTTITLLVIVVLLVAVIIGIAAVKNFSTLKGYVVRYANRVCIESHEEQYVEQPMSIVVGGGEHGGGIGIPMGVGKIKSQIVCDKYRY